MSESVSKLYLAAQRMADQIPGFFDVKGAGAGDHASLQFMAALRQITKNMFGDRCKPEHLVCKGTKFAVDFYFPEEDTVVEIAFTIGQPISEFERDIFKCLLAQQQGCAVKKLFFITKPGGRKKNEAPGPRAIRTFVQENFGLQVDIIELVPVS